MRSSVRRWSRVPALLSLLLSVACGESKEEQANRTALATIAQRNQALNQELADWLRGAPGRSDTWKNSFDKYERLIADKEGVRKDLRSVVPTAKFACLIGVLSRSLERDIQMLQSRDSYTRQLFNASMASDRATEMHNEGMASRYGYENYFRYATEARNEAAKARDQARSFKLSANTAAVTSIATADTVRALIEGLDLLPMMERTAVPQLTDSADTFLSGSSKPIVPKCKAK